MKTYGDIYKEFLENTDIDKDKISDYRPCKPPYFEYFVPCAITVWLKNGNSLIFISNTAMQENTAHRHTVSIG